MIAGEVRDDTARIRIRVRGSAGWEQDVDAVIDTGYNGTLTLPHATIAALGLRWETFTDATLADGSTCVVEVYAGQVVWDGKPRKIVVDEADTDPLVGMRLLRGHELKVQVRYRGKVTVRRLPRRGDRAS